ncbi:MAG TPA: cytidyltransferase [Prolixibacteraceae bacterium]|nr:cytidyltransferase [Prolixibacteraceae bacterium]
MEKNKKVLVSGCFDLIHAGHIAFFKTASQYGKLYVSVGQDENIFRLKGKKPYFSQEERVFMVGAVKYVTEAFISSGEGLLDFEEDMNRLKPDFFVVNTDGYTKEKKRICEENKVELIVLERIPEVGLPARSSSQSKKDIKFPYRLCLAGGWMDQPWVSEVHSGSCVVVQIWPDYDFNDRSGMATSSRKIAHELWGGVFPEGDQVRNAQLLFGAENPPGSEYISGSQDQLGILMPGANRLDYNGKYWPCHIESTINAETCDWLSRVLHLIPLAPRPEGYNPLLEKHLTVENVKELGESGELCWEGILERDIKKMGEGMKQTFLSWKKMLPFTVPDWVSEEMKANWLTNYPGAIPSGSGGGYVIVASEEVIPGALKIKVKS